MPVRAALRGERPVAIAPPREAYRSPQDGMRRVRVLGSRSPAPAGYERSHDAFPLDVESEDRVPDRRWQAAQKPASRRLPFPLIGKRGDPLTRGIRRFAVDERVEAPLPTRPTRWSFP